MAKLSKEEAEKKGEVIESPIDGIPCESDLPPDQKRDCLVLPYGEISRQMLGNLKPDPISPKLKLVLTEDMWYIDSFTSTETQKSHRDKSFRTS